jgi:hypothetical protein
MRLAPGLSWSWKRAFGIAAAKARISRNIGFPLFSQGGRERWIGRRLLRLFWRAS